MIKKELQQKIRFIQLQTRKVLKGSLVGDSKSKRKGFGLDFEQLADYQFGDDIRFIDWKSSARANKLLIKEYKEDQNRTIFIVVDGSASTLFGSGGNEKFSVLNDVAATLAFAALYQKDALGLLIFSDEVDVFIPPKVGKKHIFRIIETLYEYRPKKRKTNMVHACDQLLKYKKQGFFAFFISDFIDHDFYNQLRLLQKRNEIIAIRCLDHFESALPSMGTVLIKDIETGEHLYIDTNDALLQHITQTRLKKQNELLKKACIDVLDIALGAPFINDIVLFLKKRISARMYL